MWINQDLILETSRGFVYLIADTVNKVYYIGKKKLISETRVTVAGRKNKKRVVKPSNWKSYYGSSIPLKQAILKHGKSKFKRYILGAFDELHSVNYAEADLQFMLDVLNEEGAIRYYNKNIKITTMRYPAHKNYIKVVKGIIKKGF